MTIRDWQQLSPPAAAGEIHRRAQANLRPEQQQAVLAWLRPESELAAALAAAPRDTPLAGTPFLAKDLFDVAGVPTRAGSTFLPEVRPTPAHDSALVAALTQRGAVVAGKTHMHEFAYGITGENPHYGDCEHPNFPGRTTGGSSSGSAAAVAAGIVPLALGSDTGGSVRVPAAYCGLYGFRLTPRDAWVRDAIPLSPSYDTAGWFTATAADLRAVNDALLGPTTVTREPRGCYLEMPGLDPDVSDACRTAAASFTAHATREVAEQLLRGFAPGVETYNTTVALEAWDYHRPWAERYRERYSAGVWQRLNRSHTITAAQRVAAEADTSAVRALWAEYFLTHDFLILAASPTAAPTKTESTLEHRMRILALTAPASIGGLPVLTIPVPLPSGLTTGLQIVVQESLSPVVNWMLKRCRQEPACRRFLS
ncbi:MAG: amidase family protein [Opitutaceae bacterium]|nr:amidase family protein [Opitutaceae bacterium]